MPRAAKIWAEYSQHAPAGWTIPGRLVAVNTGDVAWNAAECKLGEWPPSTATWTPTGRLTMPAGTVIEPGQSWAFPFDVPLPAAYGLHPFAWNMVCEGVEWFPASNALSFPLAATLAPPLRTDSDLCADIILNTGSYSGNRYEPADPDAPVYTRRFHWRNQTGQALAVSSVYLWTGMEVSATADVNLILRRDQDHSLTGIQQWDHYADPRAPNHGRWHPVRMTLEPGEGLTLHATVVAFRPPWAAPLSPIRAGAHHVVAIQYEAIGGPMESRAVNGEPLASADLWRPWDYASRRRAMRWERQSPRWQFWRRGGRWVDVGAN